MMESMRSVSDPEATDTWHASSAPALGPLSLTILVEGSSRVVRLPAAGEVRIGRDPSCFISLDHASISREHALIRLGASPQLVDLDSKNGTRVAHRTLSAHAPTDWAHGVLAQVGAAWLVLRTRDAEADPTAAPPAAVDTGLRDAYQLADCVAADRVPVLVLGETGTGKGVLSEWIHARSNRAGAMVRVNGASLSPTLFESELFGHVKGAFTGATADRVGLAEAADGGTLFFDEIGELALGMQAKMLRFLEDGRVRPVGSSVEREVDVRFVAATNRELEESVREGSFRSDLYFRLSDFVIRLPPLRERMHDLLALAERLLRDACESRGRPTPVLSEEAQDALRSHAWPGNVRELKSTMTRVAIVCRQDVVQLADLPLGDLAARRAISGEASARPLAEIGDERARILVALERTAGNQTEAARLLGVSRRTLLHRLDQYDIPRPRRR